MDTRAGGESIRFVNALCGLERSGEEGSRAAGVIPVNGEVTQFSFASKAVCDWMNKALIINWPSQSAAEWTATMNLRGTCA